VGIGTTGGAGGGNSSSGVTMRAGGGFEPLDYEYGIRNRFEQAGDEPFRTGMTAEEAERWMKVNAPEEDAPFRIVVRPRGAWVEMP
jgi:hypothetical protein